MVFSYNWLQSFFKKKLPQPEKLANLLTEHSFEVSEVKKADQDWALDIDVLPNRGPDCFSHLGIARECGTLTNFKVQPLNYKLIEDKNWKTKDFLKIAVEDKKACPRYTARVVTNVKVGPSPRWLEERLKVCGLRPINNLVDIANYLMLETGQPLHTFDLEKISGRKIIVRKAKKGEKITTLDNETYDLDRDVLIIADLKDPLAIAGIKGGKKAEIDRKTKLIVLESANFNQKIIRQGSKKIDLKTDASLRFDHGLDPNLTEIAINKAASLIQDLTGGKVTQGIIDFYPKQIWPKKIRLDLDEVEKLLGVKIPAREIQNILKRLGFKISGARLLSVEVPTVRLDINIPEDLIEEIGRIYGYQRIPSILPLAALVTPKRNLDIFWEDMAKNILKEAGFNEVYNYSFVSQKEAAIFNFTNLVEVANPISADYQYLRPSLIPNLLKNVKENQKNFKEIRIFELGKIFFEKKEKRSKKQVIEKRMLTGLITGEAFYEVKGIIDLLLNKLGISHIWYDQYQPTPAESKISIWRHRKCAEIKVDQEEVGFLGEISFPILEELKLPTVHTQEKKLVVFDLDFERIQRISSEEHEFRPISPFPAAVRDIAVLVPRDVLVEEVLNKIETAGAHLIRDIDLFDIYEGEEIPEEKKNLAFHIIYQAEDRTLSTKEIDEIQNKIIKALEKDPDWQVRK